MIVQPGQFLTFAQGEYSDYIVNGLTRVLKIFDVTEEFKKWEAEHCEPRVRSNPRVKKDSPDFLAHMCMLGFVEDVDYIEIHTGYDRDDVSLGIYEAQNDSK